MKAIILAAGEGTRLKPITNTTPKPLIKIAGKTIIEHNLEHIYKYVDEIIIVVKYLKETFPKTLGDNYKGTTISYFEQGLDKGTGGAIRGIEFSGDFILINGDSIFEKEDIKKLIKLEGYGCLTREMQNPSKYGVFQKDNNGNAIKIIEKPKEFYGNTTNVGVYKFNDKLFEINDKISLSERGEYEITDSINGFCKNEKFQLINMKGEFIDIGYPWDILTANSYFLEKIKKSDIKGKIEENVIIKGNIILEKGAILKSGTYIEGNCYIGKNTSIGPNIYIRGNTVIGENCHLGANNEIKNSSIGNNTHIAHLSYVGDSIIGNNVNIGGGFITANLRHDHSNIKFKIKGELIDTGLLKLGVIIGDNVKTGIKAYSMPGRVIVNNSLIMPLENIK